MLKVTTGEPTVLTALESRGPRARATPGPEDLKTQLPAQDTCLGVRQPDLGDKLHVSPNAPSTDSVPRQAAQCVLDQASTCGWSIQVQSRAQQHNGQATDNLLETAFI